MLRPFVALALALASEGALAGPTPADAPYEDMPAVAPIGVRIGKYLDVPMSARGAPVDPAKGYRLERLGRGLFMVTDNAYQSMFMVCDRGVVVVDAPPSYAAHLRAAIAEVSDKPITHLIYSHAHFDHIGGASALGGHPIIIAQAETKRLLARAADPARPLPTVTFKDHYVLALGGQTLDLSYHGVAHEPGNIFIYAPVQKTLMVVDIISPGWMPFRRLSVAQDIPGYFEQAALIDRLPWKTLVGGHVARTGSHADVRQQLDFMGDLKRATGEALRETQAGRQLDSRDVGNPWAQADSYIDRVVIKCVNHLSAKWSGRLAGYDAWVWDQCFAMEQSLTMD